MSRFSVKETCKFLYLVRDHECLWNNKHDFYRNNHVKQAACEAIARIMNLEDFTAADVKYKLKVLKGTYYFELRKIKKFAQNGQMYVSNLKWFSIIDSFLKSKPTNQQPSGENSSSENAQDTPDGIFPDDSQCEQQCEIPSETASTSVSTDPSLPSESVTDKSIRSISEPVVITVTPEILTVQAASNSEVYPVIPEVQSVKSVSSSEVNPVTSITTTAKSSLNLEVTAVPSGIQTIKSSATPKYFTLIPDNTSKLVSNPTYIMVTPEIPTSKHVSTPKFTTIQNVRSVSNSQDTTFAPERKPRVKQASADENFGLRKRRYEDSSTNSNNDFHQINNTRSMSDDFNDRCDDEMDAFGHFVALNLRKMRMQSALSAQSEILSVLTRHRLSDSAANPPSKQMFPCILTNGTSPT